MVKVFFSYSHKDEELRNELEEHLALLKRQGIIASWHDRRISAGNDFGEDISENLESANLVLLLISASFLASDYCYEKEMRRALEKHDEGTAVVVPVILHPCDWHSSPFGKLRATPTDGKPISMHANQHQALSVVARDVREVAEKLQSQAQEHHPEPTEVPQQPEAVSAPATRSSNLRIKRTFDDHEKDQFLEDSYEYIARYFAGSLDELQARNQQIKTRLKRTSETSFTATVYENGEKVSSCSIWYCADGFRSGDIRYSSSETTERNNFNESVRVEDDGYSMHLKALGMQFHSGNRDELLSQEGAAEYFWSMLIRPLQG